ncbi:MAG: cytochrome c class [Bacteroidetes bacterium]|nr:cytochrome c class [Bacteroidota bacterium]
MSNNDHKNTEERLLNVIGKLLNVIACLMLFVAALVYVCFCGVPEIFIPKKEVVYTPPAPDKKSEQAAVVSTLWIAPDTATIPKDEKGKQIRYGRMLISNTAYYFGPHGIIQHSSNGMNCQNCHLDAGTKAFGNNYSAVASTYPKFRERSGMTESIYKRVNDCFERSLNGAALDSSGKEMQAIKAYIIWLGQNVKKGEKPMGSGITELAYLQRAADPEKGKTVYTQKCMSCHGTNGDGKLNTDQLTYQYPPLWGAHSYNYGAGLFRLSRFAGYVKSNMPLGVTYDNPQLTDEQAWDVAAYVNSQLRPTKDLSKDWPKISGKPVDHPFGPYADGFTEKQHKYGPFAPIAEAKKKQKDKKSK